jgi:antitoxin (DNA-binding transcriptional repressor) of toxin-antitoxin stability system
MAKAGKRIPVTVRGELVAYLVPAEEPTSILDRLEAAGQLRRGRGNLAAHMPPPPTPPGTPPLSQVLQEMRDEERW